MRRYRRLTIRVRVDYGCRYGVRSDHATTLGAGGLFIECEEPLPRDSILKIRFCLPGSHRLHELEGRVKWMREDGAREAGTAPGMGIQFTDPVAIAALARALNEL